MNAQQERLIRDNPNLSNEVLAKLIGVTRKPVRLLKKKIGIKQKWSHRGNKIPFFHQSINENFVIENKVIFGKRKVHGGSFSEAMINVDRLIYCLDNDGKHLLKTLEQKVFDDLEFIKK